VQKVADPSEIENILANGIWIPLPWKPPLYVAGLVSPFLTNANTGSLRLTPLLLVSRGGSSCFYSLQFQGGAYCAVGRIC
jgi:hypothetical protein